MSHSSDDDLATAWDELMGSYHRLPCVLDRELSSRHDITVSDFEVLREHASNHLPLSPQRV